MRESFQLLQCGGADRAQWSAPRALAQAGHPSHSQHSRQPPQQWLETRPLQLRDCWRRRQSRSELPQPCFAAAVQQLSQRQQAGQTLPWARPWPCCPVMSAGDGDCQRQLGAPLQGLEAACHHHRHSASCALQAHWDPQGARDPCRDLRQWHGAGHHLMASAGAQRLLGPRQEQQQRDHSSPAVTRSQRQAALHVGAAALLPSVHLLLQPQQASRCCEQRHGRPSQLQPAQRQRPGTRQVRCAARIKREAGVSVSSVTLSASLHRTCDARTTMSVLLLHLGAGRPIWLLRILAGWERPMAWPDTTAAALAASASGLAGGVTSATPAAASSLSLGATASTDSARMESWK